MAVLRASGEDYLEAILMIHNRMGEVRSVDVARELGVTKPSVCRAVGRLKDGGYIIVDENGIITLTESGKIIAESVYERHTVISDWLMRLGVNRHTACEDACRIEHDISEESFKMLKDHIEKYPV
jgi:Mn-dependent DtxR family transcriptional regulator